MIERGKAGVDQVLRAKVCNVPERLGRHDKSVQTRNVPARWARYGRHGQDWCGAIRRGRARSDSAGTAVLVPFSCGAFCNGMARQAMV